MSDDPEKERLRRLEDRIAAARGIPKDRPATLRGFGQGEVAWRMVIELATGIGVGFAIGYGLDVLFGTLPVMMVIFVLLGFAAGVRTMLGTAASLTKRDDGAEGKRD
jgi:ATP synthase protein I